MKRFPLSALAVLFMGLGASTLMATPQEEMKYLGYSGDIVDYASDALTKTHNNPPVDNAGTKSSIEDANSLSEVDSVKEQLTELGRSRSLTPQTPDKSGHIKDDLGNYWQSMGTQNSPQMKTLSDEIKSRVKDKIAAVLTEAGYEIKQLDLIDIPQMADNGQIRAVVRVIRPLKTRNGYNEIQENLAQVKELCSSAANIDGKCYLSELTTFVAENPRNKYYYEKTILNP